MKAQTGEHILEIGFTPLIASNSAYRTTYVETQVVSLPGGGFFAKARGAFEQGRRLLGSALDDRFSLVICRSFSRFIWRRELALAANALRYGTYWLIRFCVWLRVNRGGARLVVLDLDDESLIFPRDKFLLDACSLYFKRELPQNAWNTFKYLQPPYQEPIMEFTGSPNFRVRLGKLRPVPLGIDPQKVARIERCIAGANPVEKQIDVFFAGRIPCSTVREQGLSELHSLAGRDVRVDIPEAGLPFEEFVLRMARAWLVWSPEGGGWDCFRHSEICVAGSVPLINYPTIRRHRPLIEGVHCFFYGIEGGLARTIEAALADKPRLLTMANAARAHVLAYHSYPQIARYIVEASRDPAAADPR